MHIPLMKNSCMHFERSETSDTTAHRPLKVSKLTMFQCATHTYFNKYVLIFCNKSLNTSMSCTTSVPYNMNTINLLSEWLKQVFGPLLRIPMSVLLITNNPVTYEQN